MLNKGHSCEHEEGLYCLEHLISTTNAPSFKQCCRITVLAWYISTSQSRAQTGIVFFAKSTTHYVAASNQKHKPDNLLSSVTLVQCIHKEGTMHFWRLSLHRPSTARSQRIVSPYLTAANQFWCCSFGVLHLNDIAIFIEADWSLLFAFFRDLLLSQKLQSVQEVFCAELFVRGIEVNRKAETSKCLRKTKSCAHSKSGVFRLQCNCLKVYRHHHQPIL